MATWLRTDLKSYVLELLSEKNLSSHGLFRYSAVKRILDQHFSRAEIHDRLIWALVVFQVWHERYMVKQNAGDEGMRT